MIDNEIALIIDDFHYIERLHQINLIRSLRGAMFDGLKVILISVPHHAYAAQVAENELTGRLVHVEVPEWKIDDLSEIAHLGAAALNVKNSKEADQSTGGRGPWQSEHYATSVLGHFLRGRHQVHMRPTAITSREIRPDCNIPQAR